MCWADSEQQGRRTAHRLWRNELLPGALPQTLSTPRELRSATSPRRFRAARTRSGSWIGAFDEAGFDERYLQQIGSEQEEFFEAWRQQVRPHP